MKKTLLIILLFGCSCYLHGQPVKVTSSDFKKLDWLTGNWNRTNIQAGNTNHESWIKVSNQEFKGSGITMKGSDTTLVEKLKIIIKDNAIYYVADIKENKAPVLFKFTDMTPDGFVCENPEHDFPKKISYQLTGVKLKATVSGNGKAIDYYFEKKK